MYQSGHMRMIWQQTGYCQLNTSCQEVRNVEMWWAWILSRSYDSCSAVILTESLYVCVIFLQNLIWVPNDRDISAFACCCQVKLGPSKWARMVGSNRWVTCGGDGSCLIFLHSGYIEEACIIPCPSDCKLSEWSNWSRCSKSCGSGVKVRSKWLREKPYNGGRPCPKLDHVNQVFSTNGNIVKYFLGAQWSIFFLSKIEKNK